VYGRYWWRTGGFLLLLLLLLLLSKISLTNWVSHNFPSQAAITLYWFAITNGTQSLSDIPIARFEVLTAVLLKIQDYWGVNAVSWSAWPSSWRHHHPSECQELFNQLYSIISQKNWCFTSPFIHKIFLGDQLCWFRTEFQLISDLLLTDVAGCLRLFYCSQWPHNLQVACTVQQMCNVCVAFSLYLSVTEEN